MQPTWRRSAQTGAGHGSAGRRARREEQRVRDVEPLRVHLAEHRAGLERQVPARLQAVAGLPVGRGRDRAQAAAPAARGRRRRPRPRPRVDDGVVRRHLGALDRHDRPDDAVVERHGRERVQHDQARPAGEVRAPVGVARESGHERAVAQDERARLGVRRLLDHERRAGEHEPVEDDRRVGLHGERAAGGPGEQRARAVRRPQHDVAVGSAGAGRRRRDGRRRARTGRLSRICDRAAAGDGGERRPERLAARDRHDRLDGLERPARGRSRRRRPRAREP